MTKKHFKIFAALIKQSTMSENEKVAFVNALSKKCQEENAKFDIDRFKVACGI